MVANSALASGSVCGMAAHKPCMSQYAAVRGGVENEASPDWRLRYDGHKQLPKLILGVKFTDGLEVLAKRPTVSPQAPPPDRLGRHQKLAIAQ
jgi:hypothetical protein